MQQGIGWLLQSDSEHPLLLEVLTDADIDAAVLHDFHCR